MIYCPKCGTANQRGSRFCNECGESLPMRTALRCPMCGTMNPVGNLHCDRCQARLIPMAAPSSEEWEREEAPSREPAPPTVPLEREPQVEEAAEEVGLEAREAEDWLAQLRASTAEEAEVAAGEEPETMGEPIEPVEIPDWLRDMGPIGAETRTTPSEGSPSVEVSPEEAPAMPSPAVAEVVERLEGLAPAEAPDWLREIAPPEAVPPEAAPPTAEAAPEEAVPTVPPLTPAEIPDWLRETMPAEVAPLEAVPPVAEVTPEEPVPTVPPPALAEIPDWLREIAPPEAVPPEAAPPEAKVAPEEAVPTVPSPTAVETPDWLRETAWPEVALPETAPPTAEVAPGEAVPTVPPPTAIEIPDWLQETAPPEAAPPEAVPPTPQVALEEAVPTAPPPAPAEIPDWLPETAPPEATPPIAEVAPPPSPTVGVPPPAVPEPPEWLRKIALEEEAPEAVPSVPPLIEFPAEAEELARAEIPDWLEALRPRPEAAEAAAEPVETEGPLEGLGGVLAPTSAFEVLAAREHALPSGTSEVSLSRAELLQSLLAQPVEAPQPEVRERGISAGERVQRWLVAAVLLIAVGSILLSPLIMLPQDIPTLTKPAESLTANSRMEFQRLTRTYDVVQGMSAEDTLLAAFEYGPAEADELNLVAEPLLRHVLDRGAHVSIVSTRPEGKAVASGLLSGIVASEERYTESQYTLLDYQTGDAAGVSRLLTGAETRPELILVLTAQPGPLRWWVEQTRALYGHTLPVVAGVSAALEPAASPYLDASARQVEGAVSGLTGAAAYETLLGPAGQATQRLNALTAGHGAIVGLMILGALFHTFGSPRRRKR